MGVYWGLGKQNPDIYIVISNGAYLSPWWLQHCDGSRMINAGDAASGTTRTAELIYRDSTLHGRSVKENTQFPLNATFNHEPKKTHSKEPPDVYRNHLHMALSRGTGFLEFYLKPSRMHGGDPSKREIYGFTGGTADSGCVSIHNPSDRPAAYSFGNDPMPVKIRSGPTDHPRGKTQ